MRYERPDADHGRVVTVDIETTATDPSEGELVAVGVGVHDRARPLSDATYELCHRRGDDEGRVIRRAMSWLDDADPDALVTYNGVGFDLPFVRGRLDRLGVDLDLPSVTEPPAHVDLFRDRKRRAEASGEPWPSLEACLEAYGYTPPRTVWRGERVTNERFGEEIGPAYLRTLGTDTGARLRATLSEVIDHYLRTDLEATLALFAADVGASVDAAYLGTERRFEG
ncbi:ribonuclease H-like domain-containing protein [Haloplanus salilacus]|uniref:ribonuclease H-like domain-containing protein n=1 Tax=Haloplanus salilacus TaxID=2949994 RepID=UPI0030CBBC6B